MPRSWILLWIYHALVYFVFGTKRHAGRRVSAEYLETALLVTMRLSNEGAEQFSVSRGTWYRVSQSQPSVVFLLFTYFFR